MNHVLRDEDDRGLIELMRGRIRILDSPDYGNAPTDNRTPPEDTSSTQDDRLNRIGR